MEDSDGYPGAGITQALLRETLTVGECSWHACRGGDVYEAQPEDTYRFHLILDGGGSCRVGETNFRLQAGAVLLLYPGMAAHCRADDTAPWNFERISCSGQWLMALTQVMGFTEQFPAVRMGNVKTCHSIAAELLEIEGGDCAANVRRAGLLLTLFADLIDSKELVPESGGPAAAHMSDGTRAVLEYIRIHYREKILMDDVAETIGVSRSSMNENFKREMAISPAAYLISYRLQRACALLLHSDLAVNAVAAECGYEDPLSFSKAFKQRYSVGPKKFREMRGNVPPAV